MNTIYSSGVKNKKKYDQNQNSQRCQWTRKMVFLKGGLGKMSIEKGGKKMFNLEEEKI